MFAHAVRSCRAARTVKPKATQARYLNLHEHHAKELMARHNVRVQRGIVANTAAEAQKNAELLRSEGARDLILKAQILAGGRGKGHFDNGFKGGVKICDTPEQLGEYAEKMLGANLITNQTGPEGQPVKKVLVHEGVDFDKEYYLALLLERAYGGPVLVGSPCGGMDIEEIAETMPEKLKYMPIDSTKGIDEADLQDMVDFLGFTTDAVKEDAKTQIKGLYELFMAHDCTQVEINPIVETTEAYDRKVYCVDAKLGFDTQAAWRNEEIFSWKDDSMEDQREVEAEKVGLNYVGLDGNIGCMVNGAGLAMATMDIIKLNGGSPANFLDVGGGANEQQVEQAFKLLTADPNVKGILVNIFGGIMKCDTIAQGIINAAKKIDLEGMGIPLVVRLEGTNVTKGVDLLKNSGLPIQSAVDLDDAARKCVASLG